jgi:hypothetical protein
MLPSVVLVRSTAPLALRKSAAAFVDLRNAVAMCTILLARAVRTAGGGSSQPPWSDALDFHPVQINRTGGVVLQSPAQLILTDEHDLYLSGSPHVEAEWKPLVLDARLAGALGWAWRRYHLASAGSSRVARVLFRSHEAAFLAASVTRRTSGLSTNTAPMSPCGSARWRRSRGPRTSAPASTLFLIS